MKMPASQTLLVGALVLGSGTALAAGSTGLTVNPQQDGSLVISNTGQASAGSGAGQSAVGNALPGAVVQTPRPGTAMSVPVKADSTPAGSQQRYRNQVLQGAQTGKTPKNPAIARRYLMMDRGTYLSGSR